MAAPKGNDYYKLVKNPGRKLKHNAKNLLKKSNEYFDHCDKNNIPYTITGLALSMGMTRQRLIEYEQREGFRDIIKQQKARVEAYVEQLMLSGKAQAGSIFWLKNHNWQDKQTVSHGIESLDADQLAAKLKAMLND